MVGISVKKKSQNGNCCVKVYPFKFSITTAELPLQAVMYIPTRNVQEVPMEITYIAIPLPILCMMVPFNLLN